MNRIPLSALVENQLPEFIREDYPKFVAFLKAYYEYMDTQFAGEIKTFRDVDKTLDSFIDHFKEQFAVNVPTLGKLGTREFLTQSKQFYVARGSEASYRFLFRLLFGKEIDIFYPSTVILRASDGRWNQDTSVVAGNVQGGDIFDLVGKQVTTNIDDKSYRFEVQRVRPLENGFFEVFFDRRLANLFVAQGTFEAAGISFQIFRRANRITLNSSTVGFTPGQLIEVPGTGIRLRVKKINPDTSVKYLEIVEFGQGNAAQINQNIAGVNFTISLSFVNQYPGYFTTSDGFLSDVMKLQDNLYYQQFSYVLRLDEQLSAYKDVVVRLLHPSGTALFGEFELTNEIDVSAVIDLVDRFIQLFEQDDAIAGDTFELVLTKYIADEITTQEVVSYLLQKNITETVTADDSGSLQRQTAGDYTDFAPGNASSYFSEVGTNQYSTGSTTEIRTW